MPYLLYALNVLLMIALPLALATLIARRWRVSWGLFGVGAATFVGSQILHLPFNQLVLGRGLLPDPTASQGNLLLYALFLGLSAGFFEEMARYAGYRYWARDARSWPDGLMLGAGHGGIEAILLGLLAAVNVLFLSGAREGLFTGVVPAEELPLLLQQAEALFEAPWYYALLGAVERVAALSLHLALSLLVLQLFLRRNAGWLLLAIGWHALVDLVAVYGMVSWGALATEGLILLLGLVSVGIIVALRKHGVEAEAAGPAAAGSEEEASAELQEIEVELTAEKLDESRYA